MSFTMAELRHELHALGYGALPDDFIVSSLSQMQLDLRSRNNVENVGDRNGSTSTLRVPFAGKSSRQVHGPAVPGDREFAKSRKPTVRKGGMDCVCFTPDFATEVDEMRQMLKTMQGTKEVMSGASASRTIRKPMGLAGEHETYVGNLLDQWRKVGRSIRSKRKECLAGDVGALVKNCNNGSAPSSEAGTQKNLKQNQQASGTSENGTGHEAVLDLEIPPPAEPSTSRELEGPDDGCNVHAEGVNVAERNEGIVENDLDEEAVNERDMNGLRSERGGVVGVSGTDTGPVFTRQESSSAISPGVSYQQGGMLYPENFTIDTYKQSDLIKSEEIPLLSHQDAENNLLPSHQDAEDNPFSPSARSSPAQLSKNQMMDKLSVMPKEQFLTVFQKSLDDLYPKDMIDQETFANVNQKIVDTINHTHVSVRHHIAQQPVESENPLDLGVPVLVRTPDRRGGGDARHQSPLNDRSNLRMAEDQMIKKLELNSAKAVQRSSSVMLKRSRSSRVVSRRNEIVEEANDKHPLDNVEGGGQGDSHLFFENKTTPPRSTARKLKSDRGLGYSKSFAFSRRRNEIVEELNDTRLSGNVEGQNQVDSHLLVENATTPPSSARKLKSERVHRLARSAEKSNSSPRLPYRHNRTSSALDGSDLDIPSLGLSPIKVREQSASTLNSPSTRERPCVANGLSDHRPGSHCSACQPPSGPVRKSSETYSQSTTTGSKSPIGKNLNESPVNETEASPQPKRSAVRKEIVAGLESGSVSKQKPALKKSASAISPGISTPVFEPKNNDLSSNSKVLLKTRRLASSMDFAPDSSRVTERRAPSLRSSTTESSRSSGPQRAPSAQSQVSKSNSVSPYTKSSFNSRSATPNATPKDLLSSPFGKTPSFTSYGSRSSAATKDTLTPGGPRRGGKVDRVARVIEDMRPGNEPPPFVVPTALYNNSEGVCTF